MISKLQELSFSVGLTCASLLVSSIFWPLILIFSSFLFTCRYVVQKLLDMAFGVDKFKLSKGIDSLFAYDKVPGNSVIIHTVLVIKGEPDIDKIRQRYNEKVFKFVDESNSSKFVYKDRLQKTFTSKLGFACWKDTSASFDIRRHVRYMEGLEPDTRRPKGLDKHLITEDKLLRMVSGLMDESNLFGGNHPQWEHLIVPNYCVDIDNSSTPHFACIIRLHHAYTDGGSIGILIDSVLSDNPLNFAIDPFNPLPGHNLTKSALYHLQALLFGPMAFLSTLKSAVFDKSTFILPRYSNKKHLSWTRPIDMAYLKRIRTASGTSMTSIVMTLLTGAIRQEFSKRGESMPKDINVGNMCSMLPYKSRELQNQFTTFSVSCPLGPEETGFGAQEVNQEGQKRLRETEKVTRSILSSSEPLFNYFIMWFSGYLPLFMLDLLGDLAGTPLVFSNVPGAKSPYDLFGGEVTGVGAWLPMVKSFGLGVSTYSYCEELRICISTDSLLFKRREDLKSFIEEIELELEKLGKSFGILLPPQRVNHKVIEVKDNFSKIKDLNYKHLNYRKPYPMA